MGRTLLPNRSSRVRASREERPTPATSIMPTPGASSACARGSGVLPHSRFVLRTGIFRKLRDSERDWPFPLASQLSDQPEGKAIRRELGIETNWPSWSAILSRRLRGEFGGLLKTHCRNEVRQCDWRSLGPSQKIFSRTFQKYLCLRAMTKVGMRNSSFDAIAVSMSSISSLRPGSRSWRRTKL